MPELERLLTHGSRRRPAATTGVMAVLVSLLMAPTRLSAELRDTSYVTMSGERVLQIEADIPAPVADVWKAVTTGDGLGRWLGPDLAVDLRVGGSVAPRITSSGRIGSTGVASLDIVNYLDRELITFRVHLDDRFSETIREEDDRLQEIVRFVDVGNSGTKVVASMVGWGDSRIWDDAYAFFRKRVRDSYSALASTFDSLRP
jgi:uncharacterized protein YndB with AHSA1/START domain